MSKYLNRRRFISNTSASAAAILLGKNLMAYSSKEQTTSILKSENQPEGLMKEVMKFRKIDTHAHVYFTSDSPKTQLDFADRLGIEKLMISRNIESFTKGTPSEFRNCNDLILRCVKQHPDRFIGMPVLNPTYKKESLDEIQRCVDAGMVGIGELYTQVKINDPLYYPIIEKYIDLKMIILMHSAIGYSRVIRSEGEPLNISLPHDFVEIAKRYPEAMFQFA
ncbi:MAG: amidohydrolase family protein, partial [Ginsengibacter sp.]